MVRQRVEAVIFPDLWEHHHAARASVPDPIRLVEPIDPFAPPSRRYSCFAGTSCSIWLSKLQSSAGFRVPIVASLFSI